jgi:hypothetical protein
MTKTDVHDSPLLLQEDETACSTLTITVLLPNDTQQQFVMRSSDSISDLVDLLEKSHSVPPHENSSLVLIHHGQRLPISSALCTLRISISSPVFAFIHHDFPNPGGTESGFDRLRSLSYSDGFIKALRTELSPIFETDGRSNRQTEDEWLSEVMGWSARPSEEDAEVSSRLWVFDFLRYFVPALLLGPDAMLLLFFTSPTPIALIGLAVGIMAHYSVGIKGPFEIAPPQRTATQNMQ